MSVFKKISAVFLTVIFLFSGLGLTINTMVCLKSGKAKTSFSTLEDCCSKLALKKAKDTERLPGFAIIKNAGCCDLSNLEIKLNDYQGSQKVLIDQAAVHTTLFIASQHSMVVAAGTEFSFRAADLPPPISGRELLTHISTLNI